ncbi:MAG: hypothetical protein V4726_12375 [Verrucomicrobiota bacterium]
MDCAIRFINGQWVAGYVHEADSNPLDPNAPAQGTLLSLESTVLVARDQLFETGSRVLRPEAETWDFIGVDATAPLWWFPQTNWPQGNYVGFTISGPFARYQESDPRLAGSGPEKWGRINAVSLQYRGKGEGRFSVWTNSTSSGLKVWVDSRDGFQATDRYFVGDNGHGHPAFGFSALGLYRIGFQGRAWLDAQQTEEVVSPVYPSYVAVGTYAIWIAQRFSPQLWFQDDVSGDMADSDADGVCNLMEYACGLDPHLPDAGRNTEGGSPGMPSVTVLEDGSVFVTTLQRAESTNPQLTYRWETSATPQSEEWAAEPPLTRDPASEGWETVVYSMPKAQPGSSKLFGRLRVGLQAAITYP